MCLNNFIMRPLQEVWWVCMIILNLSNLTLSITELFTPVPNNKPTEL